MKNNKGQLGIGAFIMMFIGVIVAVTLLTGGITSNVGTMTTKGSIPITTQVTFPQNAQSITLTGQAVDTVVVKDGATTIGAGNYSIANYVVSNGQLISTLTGVGSVYNGSTVNISYNYEPFGYDTSAGGRTVTSFIILFAALAVAVFVMYFIYKNNSFF